MIASLRLHLQSHRCRVWLWASSGRWMRCVVPETQQNRPRRTHRTPLATGSNKTCYLHFPLALALRPKCLAAPRDVPPAECPPGSDPVGIEIVLAALARSHLAVALQCAKSDSRQGGDLAGERTSGRKPLNSRQRHVSAGS